MVQSFVLLVVGGGLSNEVLVHQDGKAMIKRLVGDAVTGI